MDSLKVTKKMEHRKQVHVSSKCKKSGTLKSNVNAKKDTHKKTNTNKTIEILEIGADDSENDDQCKVCSASAKQNEDWILCDRCDKWLHRKCAGLSNITKWRKYQKKNKKFTCSFCE